MNPHIFRAYDIRGIAIDDTKEPDLTPESIKLIGKGVGTYFQKNYGTNFDSLRPEQGTPDTPLRFVVGRDNRLTSEALQQAFIEGLLETGCHVVNIGLATSPMVYWATCALEFDGGINITASHNPKQYNGVKIVAKNAHSVCGKELQEILSMIQSGNFIDNKGQKGTLSKQSITDEYIKDLCARASLGRSMKVVVDAGNGVTGLFAEKLFKTFGCEVTPLFCELDGNYPNHEANPEAAENLIDLSKKVQETSADIGIGFDGDGDRAGIIDEKGDYHPADQVLLLLAQDLLTRIPGAQIVFDVKVSQTLMRGIRDAGGVPVMSKTGHSFIETKMKEIKSPLGGEISGHFFFGENYYGFDDAFLAALRFIDMASKSGKKVSELFEQIPKTIVTPEFKAHCPDDKKFKIVEEVTKEMEKKYPCITIDGVRVNFDTTTWGAVRCSNTSPNLTLRFESSTQEKLDNAQKIFSEALKKYPEVDMSWYTKT